MTQEELAEIGRMIEASVATATTKKTRAPREHSAVQVAALVIAMLAPVGGGVTWLMAISARVSVLEVKSSGLENAASQIAALKQELTDFRGEFRDWKRDNQRREDSLDRKEDTKRGGS